MSPVRDDVVDILTTTPLFAGIDREELRAMAGRLDERRCEAGERVVAEGEDSVEFFIVLEGTAAVERDGATVATLGPGDFFGEVAALDHGPRTASVRSLTAQRCLTLPTGGLMGFLLDHPRLAVNMLYVVVRRFQAVMTSGRSAGEERR